MTWVPIGIATEISWLRRAGQIPLLGALVAFFFSAWPATAYINLAEAALHVQGSPIQGLIGFGLAGAWSVFLWLKYRTKIWVLWIPTYYFWPGVGVLQFFHR